MHAKCTIPRQKIKTIVWGGAQPLPHLPYWGEGHPYSNLTPRRLDTRVFSDGPACAPPIQKSWIRSCDQTTLNVRYELAHHTEENFHNV